MKRIISDTFEQLEQLGQSTVKQAVQQPKKMVEEAVSAVGGKKDEEEAENLGLGSGGLGGKKPKLTQEQIAQKIEKAAKMRAKLHLQEIEREIDKIQRQRLEQIKQVQEEAFGEEKQEVQPQEVQLPTKKKRGLFSVVDKAKQKVEKFIGVSG